VNVLFVIIIPSLVQIAAKIEESGGSMNRKQDIFQFISPKMAERPQQKLSESRSCNMCV
jgi:hypothetical protein